MSEWKTIESAPKDGTVIDVWLVGELSDIEFYCSASPRKVGRGLYAGRSPAWAFANGKFRPHLGGPILTTFIEPTHWQPLPDPPRLPVPATHGEGYMSAHEPLPPIPANAPKRGSHWRHIKSREHYGVLAVGYNEADLSVVVVYTRAQTVWVRPLANFLERFKRDDPQIVGS